MIERDVLVSLVDRIQKMRQEFSDFTWPVDVVVEFRTSLIDTMIGVLQPDKYTNSQLGEIRQLLRVAMSVNNDD